MTIQELNTKWWYRLIKVAYICAILILVVISLLIVFDENKPRDISDYRIDCVADYTNHKTFYANRDQNIYLFPYGTQTVYDALSSNDRQKIRNACDITKEEADTATNKAIAYINEQEKLGSTKDAIQLYIDENMRPYTISQGTVTKGSYGSVILYSLLCLAIILLLAEIVRRVFYYIFLGSLRLRK